jgi:uncharacterized protein (TIGR02271 family)
MIELERARELFGATVYGEDGARIGTVGHLYLDDRTGQPEWVTVSTGWFGLRQSFVPLADAELDRDGLTVPYRKDQIRGAPTIDPDTAHLDPEQEAELYRHYGFGAPGQDQAMTRSEERLQVGTERAPVGRVRLRKYVVTEYVQQTVPIRREEVRLERTPVSEEDADAAGADAVEGQPEVVLHAERPVVHTETVPVERVRLAKDTVTDEQTVGDTVRREHVETDADPGVEMRDDREG